MPAYNEPGTSEIAEAIGETDLSFCAAKPVVFLEGWTRS
jgi:hypothetical protein